MAIQLATASIGGANGSDLSMIPLQAAALSAELGASQGLEETYVGLLENAQRLLVGTTTVLGRFIMPSELDVLLGLGHDIELCPQHAAAVEKNLAERTEEVGMMVREVEEMEERLDAMRRRLEELERQDRVVVVH